MSEDKRIVEINGVKMELDLRHARRIEEIRVGDRVRVLIKSYSDSYTVYPGTVIGFEPFEKLPTIIVAYISSTYADAELKFVHFNAKTEDTEIIKALDDDHIELDRADIINKFEIQIEKHRRDISDIQQRRAYFERQFRNYWEPVEADVDG